MDPKVKTRGFSITGGEESLDREEKVPRSSLSASPSNRSISAQDEPAISGLDRSSNCNPCPEGPDKQIRSSARLKYPQEKKKAKVDWTPELHKKFVQAVEKLGIDKAVPSRILELMGTDRLTRHNVASHLQKYRSHRKHVLAREAEALSWTRRRQIRGSASNPRIGKRDTNVSTTVVRTTGFPQITPLHRHNRPLHVWGHPSADQSLMYTWPNQPRDPTFWYWHQNVPAQGLPCYPPYMPTSKLAAPVVPGIIPSASMYRVDAACVGVPVVPNGQTLSRKPYDFHASKERIDAVIGDVLSKPWLPLPLGLKAPSFDSVMVELQRQGISKIPPNFA